MKWINLETEYETMPIKKKAQELAEKIRREGVIRIGNETIKVNNVTIFRETGTVTGWSIIIDGKKDTYTAVTYGKDEQTYAIIRMKKPGIVVAIGEDLGTEGRVSIIYKEKFTIF